MPTALHRVTAALAAAFALSPGLVPGDGRAWAQEAANDAATDELPVDIIVNAQPMAEPALLLMRSGRIFARASDLAAWGLTGKAIAGGELIGGESYIALDRVKGLVARLDADGAALHVQAEPSLFPRLAIDPARSAVPVAAAVPAQFVDYDLTLSDWDGMRQLTGLVDAGFSGAWGVASSDFLVDTSAGRPGGNVVRLDTSLRRDFPDRRMRLVLGDAVGSGAPWSRPVRYGGLFLGTDFSLDPQAINFPLPVISGSALTPSTVELLSESSRRALEVGPGVFDLSLQPRLNGAGQVTMSVRDIAGNTRQVTRSFYASPNLLRPGLSEFSIEAGALRRDFGFDNFGYGPLFAAAGLRRGITGTFTLEGRIEVSGATRMAGAGAAMVVNPIGEFQFSGAVSQGVAGTGTLVRASAQRITPVYTLSASYERADAQFRQVGESRFNGGGRSELVVAGGLSLGGLGSVNASYARLRQGVGGETPSRFDLASAYYSTNVRAAYLSVGVQYTGRRSDDGFGARAARSSSIGLFGSLTVPLGPRRHVSAIADQGRAAVSFDQNVPEDAGLGMRALAGVDRGSAWLEGGLAYRTAAGDVRIDAAQRQGRQGVQVNARGGLLRIDGALMASQHIDDGFALVDVASDTPVTVMVENRPKPRKAGQGRRVIVTGLQPYAENHIAIDAADLSIEAGLDAQAQVVAPGWRQAVRVGFGSAGRLGARLRLVDRHGNPVQTGSTFAWSGGSGLVGYDGEIWIEDYAGGGAVLRVSGANGACRVVVPQLAGEDRLTAAVPVTCVAENEWVLRDGIHPGQVALAEKEPTR